MTEQIQIFHFKYFTRRPAASAHPLQQGLRLVALFSDIIFGLAASAHPLQQGLRQGKEFEVLFILLAASAHPLQQGLRLPLVLF